MDWRLPSANLRKPPFLVACALALVMAMGLPAFAQQATRSAADDHALIEQLLKRVAELEQDVKTLRAAESRRAEPAMPAEQTSPTQMTADMHDAGMAGGSSALRIRGFGDINFRSAQPGGAPNTFSVGPIDLFLSSKLGERFSAVSELVFEPDDENRWGIDAERMLLQFSMNDYFSVAAGRYHAAIGYYNTAYHHGTWFQTATGRPFIFNFEDEGGLLPIHGVGVTAQGRIPSGSLGLRYVAEISNGRRSRSVDDEPVQNQFDENRHKAINLAVLARPDWVRGLEAGLSVYRDRLTPAGRAAVGETIIATHAVYQTSLFELLNEALFIRHAPDGVVNATTTRTFYSQVARQFGRYHPYARYEFIDVPVADAIFGGEIGRLRGPSFGLRFDAAEPVALKLQVNHLSGPARNRINGLTAQLAFTF